MIKQRLIDRHPALGAEELVARFRPPRRFAAVRFGGYIPNSSHPSQKVALDEMHAFATDTDRLHKMEAADNSASLLGNWPHNHGHLLLLQAQTPRPCASSSLVAKAGGV